MGIASVASKGLNYAGRLLFDDRFASKVTSSIRAQGKYYKKAGNGKFFKFHNQVGEAFTRAEKVTGNKGIFESFTTSLKNYKGELSTLWKSEKGIFSKLGGSFKGLFKRAPLIGTALMVAFEIPNIIKATLDGGIINGAVETAKSGGRLASSIACGAIGTAIGGPLLGLVGFFVGDKVGKLFVGKSYSEKKEEQEMAQAEQLAMVQQMGGNPYGTTMSPQQLMMMQQMLSNGNMNDDFMAQAYFKQLQGNQQPQLNVQA